MSYAELHCISNYSFLKGASTPEELVGQAAKLGYSALAITDECSVSGVVRAHVAAQQTGLHLIIGSEFRLSDGTRLVLIAIDREGYGNLCELITYARRQAKKGSYRLALTQLTDSCLHQCIALWIPCIDSDQGIVENQVATLKNIFNGRLWLAVELFLGGNASRYLQWAQALGARYDIPLCASGDVHMHVPNRRRLQDLLTAIRLNKKLDRLGYALYPNAQRSLRSIKMLKRIYPKSLLDETKRIAGFCRFSLDELRYEYPSELVPSKYTSASWLAHLAWQGAKKRWPEGVSEKIRKLINHELTLIESLEYEPYFLTVYDIVRFAKAQGILCQGRGSAANSTVCYCLGITEVDPQRMSLLFERFISKERNEPPDIDVDFEHERREEVIQYIYHKYGRDRAALAATIITYQVRSAIRDVGKALGFSLDQVDRLAKAYQWWDGHQLIFDEEQTGLGQLSAQANKKFTQLLELTIQIIGFPRHLSQHVGGFVIAAGKLSRLVPVENAAMPDRTVIQWEKDDLETLGLLKIDVLGLGMLSAIRKALLMITGNRQQAFNLADVPAEDPNVYAMMCRADTVGVFQIESRAQMSMLARLKPKNYYDLVIQIAIVRPGPIQGDMVHPYLARRAGRQTVTYPSEAVKKVLERTLGVPIFQEQVMQLAMTAAGFSAGEADQLRRSMAAWKKRGGLEKFESKLKEGMKQRGYSEQFANQIFRQIQGFGDYGFPESHSASFALLAYVSAWLKHYHPAAFTCALLNSQPMGFYSPSQLIQDARRHGVQVEPVDLLYSEYDSSLEYVNEEDSPVLRLGLRLVKGLCAKAAKKLVRLRKQSIIGSHNKMICQKDLSREMISEILTQITAEAGLNKKDLQSLASADAFTTVVGNRHRAYWHVSGIEKPLPLLRVLQFNEATPMLREPDEGENIMADYASIGLTLRKHPLALLRKHLGKNNYDSAAKLFDYDNNKVAKVAGIVVSRQRPSTAEGVIFITLEDETGYSNIIVWHKHAQAQRQALLKSRLLGVTGHIQKQDGVLYLIAGKLEDMSYLLGELQTRSRDFH